MADELAREFLFPPFTVLSTRSPIWQGRRDRWVSLGIQSELGREENLAVGKFKFNVGEKDEPVDPEGWLVQDGGTSIFDPVLCEALYRWFSPRGGHVLDPFAGGSVRGVVAGVLGRDYTGIELRAEQVWSNREQATAIKPERSPTWIVGDSAHLPTLIEPSAEFDFVFSCPPYVGLEVYSDNPADLSTMKWETFRGVYRDIIRHSVAHLKPNRFACFVVGDVRDKKGNYYNFPAETISAFLDAGCGLYNEAVLMTPVGSLPVRTGPQFRTSRKMGKTHQNIFVFVKGDARKATEDLGPVDMLDSRGLFSNIPVGSALELFD